MMFIRLKVMIVMTLLFVPISLQALEDPTRPPGASLLTAGGEADATGMQLTSTLVSAGRRLAIINGQTVRQGQQLGNARVIKIEPTAVIVVQNGERKRLALLPSTIKKDKR